MELEIISFRIALIRVNTNEQGRFSSEITISLTITQWFQNYGRFSYKLSISQRVRNSEVLLYTFGTVIARTWRVFGRRQSSNSNIIFRHTLPPYLHEHTTTNGIPTILTPHSDLYTRAHAHTHKCTHTHTHICTHIHMHTHLHAHTHTHSIHHLYIHVTYVLS